MRRRKLILGLLGGMLVVLLAIATTTLRQPSPTGATLTISGAASTQDALKAVAERYRQVAPETEVVFNFASSGALQSQIEQGAPVDIFLSAAPRQMDALEKQGLLLAGTRRDLLRNQLVLIAAPDVEIASFDDLTSPQVERIVIGNPESVPAGEYSQEMLASLALYDALTPKLVFAKDVRQALAYVETGSVAAGLVYTTDAALSSNVRVVAIAPPDTHAPIVYPVAAIADTPRPEAAEAFLNFLSGEAARAEFEQYGFQPAD